MREALTQAVACRWCRAAVGERCNIEGEFNGGTTPKVHLIRTAPRNVHDAWLATLPPDDPLRRV